MRAEPFLANQSPPFIHHLFSLTSFVRLHVVLSSRTQSKMEGNARKKITDFFGHADNKGPTKVSDDRQSTSHDDRPIENETTTKSHAEANEDEDTQLHKHQTVFQESWIKRFGDWLTYDESKKKMYCTICKEMGFTNTMALGTCNFKTSTLLRHVSHREHQRALAAPKEAKNMQAAVKKVLTKEENAIIIAMKAVYWLCQEVIPLSKYTSLMKFLQSVGTPHIESLKVNEAVSYSSYDTALDLLSAMSDTINKDITEKIQKSPVLTVMTDESTDIKVHHKLVINCRIVNPDTLTPSTLFLTDIRITSATGEGIFNAIKQHLAERNVDPGKVTGLGTDGASVMTGRKNGLTGQFLRHNPQILNCHCSAHRVALVSEQAANSVPSMKEYQKALENLYYHFKKSPTRSDKLQAIHKVLEDPQLKYREIHSVRWLSFYNSVEAVYKTFDSLLSYLMAASEKDATAAGLKKHIGNDFFISMTYHLMDILKPIMSSNLLFQKKDIDIGNVKPAIEACLGDLQAMKDDPEGTTYAKKLKEDLVDGRYFKENHEIPKSKFSTAACVRDFVQSMIDNLNRRFPDQELLSAFCVLWMRPITMLTKEDVQTWGDDSIARLVSQFGVEQKHVFEGQEFHSDALVHPDETRQEWPLLKNVVVTQSYPTHSTVKLWELIVTYHREQFPNLIKLASLALTHPIHTADCERSFSSQNQITTPLRNRLSPVHTDQLMRVKIEGSDLDFMQCLMEWRKAKQKLILKK